MCRAWSVFSACVERLAEHVEAAAAGVREALGIILEAHAISMKRETWKLVRRMNFHRLAEGDEGDRARDEPAGPQAGRRQRHGEQQDGGDQDAACARPARIRTGA